MLIKPEEWKREWGIDNLIFASEHEPLLPPIAREFLTTYGLPRRVIFENPEEGEWEDEAYVSAEISFEPLLKPLVSYDKTLNTYDPDYVADEDEEEDPWSRLIVIGEEEWCNASAGYCVHQFSEVLTRFDVEYMDEGQFVNSSLPQFGESLLAVVRWSKAIQQGDLRNWKDSLHELANALDKIDAAVFKHSFSNWPMTIQHALHYQPGFLEITADPRRSKPRF